MKGPSPLLGYNTNVRHHGKLYHIQTEDSGVKHPHIITHLFADGGRIISSKKTSYAEHVGSDDCQQIVKKLMQQQHKAMFIALRDGEFDEDEAPAREQPADESSAGMQKAPPVDVAALERAAARFSQPTPPKSDRPTGAGIYQTTQPARSTEHIRTDQPAAAESIFGNDLLSEKSLDEVILSYLAEDLEEPD